jgi:hypothetical protein
MKKGLFFVLFSVFLLGATLAVKKSESVLLRKCGIKCQSFGKYCVFAEGDREELSQIKKYLLKEYGIKSFFISSEINLPKIKKTNTVIEPILKKKKFENLSELSKKEIYSYQVFTSLNLKAALKVFEKVKKYPHARIEKIRRFFVVRVGIFKTYKKAKEKKLPFFLIKCYYIPSRIIEN